MIEFLRALVDSATKALPAILKKNERDASARLGADLFLIYVQFNEALVLGERIVRGLEAYVERMTDHTRTVRDYELAADNWVGDKIHQQLRNLTGIRNRLEHWEWHLQVLDGRSTNELRFLLDGKRSALFQLARTVDNQRLPLRTTGVLIDDRGVLSTQEGEPSDTHRLYHILGEELAANSVPMDERWGPEVLAIVRNYLASRKPREQLEEIRTSLEQIRMALETNFSISDILLRVGDPRADRSRRW